jgi:hypothetical protein
MPLTEASMQDPSLPRDDQKGENTAPYKTTHAMGSLQKLPLAMGSFKGSFCKLPIAWVVSD